MGVGRGVRATKWKVFQITTHRERERGRAGGAGHAPLGGGKTTPVRGEGRKGGGPGYVIG